MGIRRDIDDSSNLTETNISEDEAALYDRQIRLWGIESQKRLRESKILLIGLGGLGAEVAKNITLAGIKSITLLDNKNVQPTDYSAQFFLPNAGPEENRAAASLPGIHQLNPNVEVLSDNQDVNDKEDSFFTQFNVICATDCPLSVLHRLNKISRENSLKFFCGDTWGLHGYCFLDLLHQKFNVERLIPQEDQIKAIPKTFSQSVQYCSLEKALSLKIGKSGTGLEKKTSKSFFLMHILNAFREKHNRFPAPESRESDIVELKALREAVMESLGFDVSKVSDEMLSNVFGEVSPICAIVGGVLAQEIIKAISAKDEPIQNFFLFNGDESQGEVENIGHTSSA